MSSEREFQRCTICIMDTTDPEIIFDENGQCNHCRTYEDWYQCHINNPISKEERLQNIVAEIKAYGKGKDYDCIMGLSGGVDSSYLAYYATQKLGLRVMAVHVDTGWNSELAVNNIETIVTKLGIDLHTLVIDWNEIRDLQRAFFLSSVPNCDIPQDHAFVAALNREALKFKHKHVLNGSNMATESILPTSWGYTAMDLIHIKDIHRRYGKVKLKNYPTLNFYEKYIVHPLIHKLKVHNLLELIDYNKANAKDLLINELGWRDYGGKHYESKFTQFFQAHYLPEKYGYDKRLAHLSSLVASGQMTREEALIEIEEPLYDPVSLEEDREFFIKKLGFSETEWAKIMSDDPKSEDDYKNEKRRFKTFQKINKAFKLPIKMVKAIIRFIR